MLEDSRSKPLGQEMLVLFDDASHGKPWVFIFLIMQDHRDVEKARGTVRAPPERQPLPG